MKNRLRINFFLLGLIFFSVARSSEGAFYSQEVNSTVRATERTGLLNKLKGKFSSVLDRFKGSQHNNTVSETQDLASEDLSEGKTDGQNAVTQDLDVSEGSSEDEIESSEDAADVYFDARQIRNDRRFVSKKKRIKISCCCFAFSYLDQYREQ